MFFGNSMTKLTLLLFTYIITNIAVAAPKNIIFLIGDGMGPAYTSAYRYFKDDPKTPEVERTIFDSILVGTASTYPDDDTYVTDSAASATALATGVKSFNGAIGVDRHMHKLQSIMKQAKRAGKATGLVVTSQINHATPASFIAHNKSRRDYNNIANDYLDIRINNQPVADLMLGGGTKYFIRKDRNLVNELKQLNYQYIDSMSQLNKIEQLPAIGLFAPIGLTSAIDSENPFRLNTMTTKALSLMKENKNGFFLLLEGSQVDWCGHINDIACAMREMDDVAKTIKTVIEFIKLNPDTLLVVTADHSTGGLSIGANKVYKWNTDIIKNQKNSTEYIAQKFHQTGDIKYLSNDYLGFTLTTAEQEVLLSYKKNLAAVNNRLTDIINYRTYTGWTSHGHDAVDVQVFSYGKNAYLFNGFQDNIDIANKLSELINN